MKQNNLKAIGITGGVGCGKSAIMGYLKDNYNCEIILADNAAHDVKMKGTSCYNKLVNLLGKEVLDADGEIDKAKMAAIIFSDACILKQVNDIIHPEVKQYIIERIATLRREGEVKFFFLEAALLIEDNYSEILDEIWYIYASEDTRRNRLKISRNYSDEKIDSIMKNQLSEEEFRKHCQFVIDNDKDLSNTYMQLKIKLEGYL